MVSHLYLHIPYCTTKCDYCDFYSVAGNKEVSDEYVYAMFEEIKDRYNGDKVDTVFFGGGTPSLLSGRQVSRILGTLNLSVFCEVTIECNPETINLEKMRAFKSAGVNRISIGVQSFDDAKLKAIGRYRACNPLEKFDMALSVFDNVGIDLMYALPGQKLSEIRDEISRIPEQVKHVSYYSLTLEEGTNFYERNKRIHPIPDDLQADMAEIIVKQLHEKGLNRYEISNYSKVGYECKHNLAYWNYEDYLGIGAGAASTIKGSRIENVQDIQKYIRGNKVASDYKLSEEERENERIMMGLRTVYGILWEERYAGVLQKYPDLLSLKEGRIVLTDKGFQFHDTIVSELML